MFNIKSILLWCLMQFPSLKHVHLPDFFISFIWFLLNIFYRQKPIRTTSKLQAENGKEMLAVNIMSASIRFMMCDCLSLLSMRYFDLITLDEIQWVITIPGNCCDFIAAKKFMTDAAEMVKWLYLHQKIIFISHCKQSGCQLELLRIEIFSLLW